MANWTKSTELCWHSHSCMALPWLLQTWLPGPDQVAAPGLGRRWPHSRSWPWPLLVLELLPVPTTGQFPVLLLRLCWERAPATYWDKAQQSPQWGARLPAYQPSEGGKSQPNCRGLLRPHANPATGAWLSLVKKLEVKRAFPGLSSFSNVLFHRGMFNFLKWFNWVSIFKLSQLIGFSKLTSWLAPAGLHREPPLSTPRLKTRLFLYHDTNPDMM